LAEVYWAISLVLDPEHKAKNLKTLETIFFETFFNAKPGTGKEELD
jgi:hypothetical protein